VGDSAVSAVLFFTTDKAFFMAAANVLQGICANAAAPVLAEHARPYIAALFGLLQRSG
jgi:hypothetical protein